MKIYQLQALYYLLENYNYFVEQEGKGKQYELVIKMDKYLIVGSFIQLTSFYSMIVEVTDVNMLPKTIIVPKNDYRYYPNECFKNMIRKVNRASYRKTSITETPELFFDFLVSVVSSTNFNKKKHRPLLPYIKNPKILGFPNIILSILKLEENCSAVGLREKNNSCTYQ